jgi:hypothetical protein
VTSDAQVVVVSKKKKDTPVKVTFIGYDKPLHQKCGKPTTPQLVHQNHSGSQS